MIDSRLAAIAFHESGHTIAAFHWDVPIGKTGVSIGAGGGWGHSSTIWDGSALSGRHEENIGTLLGPFAEYEYLKRHHIAVDDEEFFLASKKDFRDILKTPELSGFVDGLAGAPTSNPLVEWTFCSYAEKEFGLRCLSLWREQRSASLGEEALAQLVNDTDRMLSAYWEQITALAERLLCAERHRLSELEVNGWRDDRFHRCSL